MYIDEKAQLVLSESEMLLMSLDTILCITEQALFMCYETELPKDSSEV